MSYTTESQLLMETEAAYVINCSVSALQKSRLQHSTKILDGLAPKFVKVGGKVRALYQLISARKAGAPRKL